MCVLVYFRIFRFHKYILIYTHTYIYIYRRFLYAYVYIYIYIYLYTCVVYFDICIHFFFMHPHRT